MRDVRKSMTDPRGTRFIYNGEHQLIEVENAEGGKTSYTYNLKGLLISRTQYLGSSQEILKPLTTTYHYNKQGLLSQKISPTGLSVSYEYDLLGQLISVTDEEGFVTQYTYSLERDLVKISYQDGKTVEYIYNSEHQVTQMNDWVGTSTFELGHNQTIQIQDPKGNVLRYTYNTRGQKENILYPNQQQMAYQYDLMGRLIKASFLNLEMSYQYDDLGRLVQERSPSHSVRYTYDGKGRRTMEQFFDTQENPLYVQKYGFDEFDNKIFKQRTSLIIDQTEEVHYSYDQINQLKTIEQSDQMTQFYYDALGNRIRKEILQKGKDMQTTTYQYNNECQLIKVVGHHEMKELFYDKRGNLIKVIENGLGITTYTFDATNHLVSTTDHQGKFTQYTYDSLGRRVLKSTEREELHYLYDVTSNSNSPLVVWGDKVECFFFGNGLLGFSTQMGAYYTIKDDLGNCIVACSETGKTEMFQEFDPFGTYSNQGDQVRLNAGIGFTGHTYDVETGMVFAGARYYIPELGRFISRDPYSNLYGENADNPYIYCDNNPLCYTDPSGYWKKSIHQYKTEEISRHFFLEHGFSLKEAQSCAHIIARGDQGVDINLWTTSFFPDGIRGIGEVVGDQGWHFNMNIKYESGSYNDSRVIKFRRCYAKSVKHFKKAQSRYDIRKLNLFYHLKAFLSNSCEADLEWESFKILQQKRALHILGMGLHPLQDLFAHMDFGYEDIKNLGGVYTLHPKEYDDPEYDNGTEGTLVYVGTSSVDSGSEWLSKRWLDTKTATIKALENFMKETYQRK